MANLRTFDLNLLRVLDALLQDHSTVRAGQRLGLSQPAVSAALQRLRDAFGDELFFRKGQGLVPTHFALSLEVPVQNALDDIGRLLAGPDGFDPMTCTDGIRLSGSDFFAEMLMPKLAEHLQVAAPGMRVHLVDLVADSYVDTLDRHQVDIALIPQIDLPDWVECQKVFQSAFAVIARKGNARLRRAGITPGEVIPIDLYCDLGHVVFSPEGNSRSLGDAALERVGRSRRVVMTMPVFSGVYRAVAGSDLVALLPVQMAREVAPFVGVEIYRPPMPVLNAQLCMVWHRRNSANPAHIWMRDQIAKLLAPLDTPKLTD